jgi:hypothetical protein
MLVHVANRLMGSIATGRRRESKEHSAMGAAAWSVAEPAKAEDQRRHQRVKVRLAGRFMRSDRLEFDCVSIDASPGGIAFSSDARVQPGERIVAYLNQIGRIEGKVARTFAGGFAVQMSLPPAKRDRLADQLTGSPTARRSGCPRTGATSALRRATGTRPSGSRTDANLQPA